MAPLRVAFDQRLPAAQWGPLFHVLRLERPDVRLEWRAAGFPIPERSLLEGTDVGVLLAPPKEDGLDALTIGVSPMAVVMAVGHRLARGSELRVADVLDEPFPGGADLHPEWRAFWTLDAQRGGPPKLTDDGVSDAAQGLEVVVAGRAIATLSASIANGLPHPGIVAIPLADGPSVPTRLLWRSNDPNPIVRSLIDLARSMIGDLAPNGSV
jgi:DNA-binding transcriptional LysR family regulator